MVCVKSFYGIPLGASGSSKICSYTTQSFWSSGELRIMQTQQKIIKTSIWGHENGCEKKVIMMNLIAFGNCSKRDTMVISSDSFNEI